MGPFKDGWTESQVEEVIERNSIDEVLYAPIVVSMDPPSFEWSNAVCLKLCEHPDETVRGNAILGFGHLARTCGRVSSSAIEKVREAFLDESNYVQGHAIDAKDDIEHFTKMKINSEQGSGSKG